MKKLFFISTLFFITMVGRGGTIQWDIANWYYDIDGYWSGQYILDISDFIIFPTQQLITTPDQATLVNFRWGELSRECTMLLTSPGTFIDYNLFENSNDFFYQTFPNWPFPGTTPYAVNLEIPKTNDDLMNTIMIAFALSKGSPSGAVIDYYGWIEFGYNGNEVYILNSAMIDGMWSGIYAGVPEPSTAFLVLSGCAVLLFRRKKSHTKNHQGVTP